MGTRHLITVKDESGATKIAQYGQWDGYPSGQGITVLDFLRNNLDKPKLAVAMQNTRFATENEVKSLWLDVGVDIDACNGLVNMDIADKFKAKNPQLDRDMGGDIVQFVQDSGGTLLEDASDFAEDGLFCEYHYIIDFKENTFEVSGMKSYTLDSLPTDEQFLADLNEDEDEE